jgi:Domain of unknown function (DUF4157)
MSEQYPARKRERDREIVVNDASLSTAPFPGKTTAVGTGGPGGTAGTEVQRKARAGEPSQIADWQMDTGMMSAFGLGEPVASTSVPGRVQRKGPGAELEGEAALAAGARGVSGPSTSLPHGEAIQRSFGRHDVSTIQAHVGGDAAISSRTLGAEAYATGSHVAFAAQPSLHTAAHEAAHVVQQRAGISLKGGVGQAGDAHEQHADAVADRVVRGESAEGLLDSYGGGARAGSAHDGGAVQRMRSDEALGATVAETGRMAVVGVRTQELYAAAGLIAATNQRLASVNARVQLTQGNAWARNDALFKVIPQVVSGAKLTEGVSDQQIHPVLQSCSPLSDDAPAVREEKTARYRQLWAEQRQMMLALQAACGTLAGVPDASPKRIRDFVEAEAPRHAIDGASGAFFKTLAIRNLLQELDSELGALKQRSITKAAVNQKVLDKRNADREDDPFGAASDEEEDGFDDDVPEAFYTDAELHPGKGLELELARAAAYDDALQVGDTKAEHAALAIAMLQELFVKTLAQIEQEIAADGAEMIGPKWCSDMTRFVHGGKKLTDIAENQAGGRVHYKTKDEHDNEMFHSAAVIMEDGEDLVTLEADEGSGELPVGKRTWWFHMYSKGGEDSFIRQTKRRWGLA